jgi:hypothetical protein
MLLFIQMMKGTKMLKFIAAELTVSISLYLLFNFVFGLTVLNSIASVIVLSIIVEMVVYKFFVKDVK